jgi:hypothetical protein
MIIIELISALLIIVLGLIYFALIYLAALVLNVWVVLDKGLGMLTFFPAPLSWALICGLSGFLIHLGCQSGRA